jgi:hypothetical protein
MPPRSRVSPRPPRLWLDSGGAQAACGEYSDGALVRGAASLVDKALL